MAETDDRATTTIEQLLVEARRNLDRLSPADASEALARGAVLVDIRSERQCGDDGSVPGAQHVPRNVLEWRLDPNSPHRAPALARRDRKVILLCNEGYQSSLAAATLRRFGLNATDVVGGFQAWREAGMPVQEPPPSGSDT